MLRLLTITCLLGVMVSTTPVAADPPPWAPAHGRRAKDAEREEYRYRDEYRDREYRRVEPPRVVGYETTVYRGHDCRYYCRHSDGTVGLIAGAAIGGLIGNRLAPGKSATLGTLLGAGAGAVIGQQLDKGSVHCE